MNKKKAKIIAETISNENLQIMLNNTKDKIKDWTKISSVNKSLTKGTAWNILASDVDYTKLLHSIDNYCRNKNVISATCSEVKKFAEENF